MQWTKRDIKPERSKVVEAWLSTMCGEKLPEMQEWVRTALDTDRTCPVLYLYGPPRTGKTTFAQGLSRLWGRPGLQDDYFDGSDESPVCIWEFMPGDEQFILDKETKPNRGERLLVLCNREIKLPPVHWLAIEARSALAGNERTMMEQEAQTSWARRFIMGLSGN